MIKRKVNIALRLSGLLNMNVRYASFDDMYNFQHKNFPFSVNGNKSQQEIIAIIQKKYPELFL